MVANKADLVPMAAGGSGGAVRWPPLPGGRAAAAAVETSAATGAGLDALRAALLEAAGLAQVAPGALLSRARPRPCIHRLALLPSGLALIVTHGCL